MSESTSATASAPSTIKRSIIVCAGLNCLDLQLIGCTKSGQEEAIEKYEKAVYCAGGSACMTATTLGQLISKSSSSKLETTTTTTTTTCIQLLTKVGRDRNGEIILDFMSKADVATNVVIQDSNEATAMSVLPIFQTGGRGCYFNLASNNNYTKEDMIFQLNNLIVNNANQNLVNAFLFGYPHLLPKLQGTNLKEVLEYVKMTFGNETLVGIDLNGVNSENHTDDVLKPALPFVDVLHLNEEEAEILLAKSKSSSPSSPSPSPSGSEVNSDDNNLYSIENLGKVTKGLHAMGCAVVLLSLGSKGVFISVTEDTTRLVSGTTKQISEWEAGSQIRIPAYAIESGEINTNGAGDALFAGFCFAVTATTADDYSCFLTLEQAGKFAALVARQRCDVQTRESPSHDHYELLDMVRNDHNLPPTIP